MFASDSSYSEYSVPKGMLGLHLSAYFGLRTVLQIFAILHLSNVVTRFFPDKVNSTSKGGPEAMQFGMEALTQSRAGVPNRKAFPGAFATNGE